jgi:hypothetical protein
LNNISDNDIIRLQANNSDVVTVQQGGNVGIGTNMPQSNLHVVGTSLFTGVSTYNTDVNIGGNAYIFGNSFVSGNQTAGVMNTTTSDRRMKNDFKKITSALEKLKTLTGYTYARKDVDDGRRYTGLVAQEVEAVLPEAVIAGDDPQGTLSLAYGNMMGLVVEAIKELSDKLDALMMPEP